MERRLHPATTVLALSCAVACVDGAQGLALRTRHLDITVLDGEEVLPCGGELAALDGFYERLHALYGLEPPHGPPLPVVVWPPGERPSPCSETAQSCYVADDGTIYAGSFGFTLRHELSHAALQDGGQILPFLSEGLAEASVSNLLPTQNLGWDPREVIFEPRGVFGQQFAEYFVAFMLERFGGPAAVRAVMRARADNIDEIFVEELGEDLDAVAEAFMGQSKLCSLQSLDCEAPMLAEIAEGWTWEPGTSCGLPTVLGRQSARYLTGTIAISEGGDFVVGVEDADLALVSCVPCEERQGWLIRSGESQTLTLDPGTWFLQLVPQGPSTAARVELERLGVP